MKSYVESLAILLAADGAHCSKAHRAAGHLVAAQVVKSSPIPEPAVCDAEMRELGC